MNGPDEVQTDPDQVEQLMEWCFHAWSNDERERRDKGEKPFDGGSFMRIL